MSAGAPVRLVHLLRHGEPVLTGRMLGRTDAPATAAGIEACVRQAGAVAFGSIVSSDLVRARACADAVAVGRKVSVDPRWRELDFGEWDGRASAELDPAALAGFWDDPDANPPPGGERWSALVARVGAGLAECPDGALVVTHAGAMRAALAGVCGWSAAQAWCVDLPYAALVTLRLWDGSAPSAQIVRLLP